MAIDYETYQPSVWLATIREEGDDSYGNLVAVIEGEFGLHLAIEKWVPSKTGANELQRKMISLSFAEQMWNPDFEPTFEIANVRDDMKLSDVARWAMKRTWIFYAARIEPYESDVDCSYHRTISGARTQIAHLLATIDSCVYGDVTLEAMPLEN